MQEHAEKVADSFVSSLTRKNIEELASNFLRLEATGKQVEGAPIPPKTITDEELKSALLAASTLLATTNSKKP
jgi:hypothetical protein